MIPELSIEELTSEAEKAYKDKLYIQAANSYAQIAVIYDARSELVLAAEMRNNQSVALLLANNAQAALKAALNTDVIFAEAKKLTKQAMALSNQAAALEALGKDYEALSKYQDAAKLLRSTGEIKMLSIVLKQISIIQLRNRRPLESLASMNSALNASQPDNAKEKSLKKLLSILFKKEDKD